MRITVTGASGGLGEHVVRELAAAGNEPVLFDRVAPDYATEHRVVLGDVTDPADCARAVERAAVVVHLAGIPFASEQRPGMPPDETMRVNAMGTYQVLDAAARAGVRTVVAASSLAPLGLGVNPSGALFTPLRLPVDEEHPLAPENSYALSKRLAEEILAAFARGRGMRCYALRLAGVLRPGLSKAFVDEHAAPARWNNWMYSYVDARDAARAFRLCLETAERLPPFDVFNVAAPDSFLFEDTAVVVARLRPDLAEKAAALEGHESMVDPRKAERAFGFRAEHGWRELVATEGGP